MKVPASRLALTAVADLSVSWSSSTQLPFSAEVDSSSHRKNTCRQTHRPSQLFPQWSRRLASNIETRKINKTPMTRSGTSWQAHVECCCFLKRRCSVRGLVVGGKSVARSRVTQAQSKREQKVTKSRLSPFGDTFLPEKKHSVAVVA